MRLPLLVGLTSSLLATSLLAAVVVADPASAADEPVQLLGRTHHTGEFHAHTSISDGVQLPADAFRHVATRTEADFFALTEHDVLFDRRNADDHTTDWRRSVSQEWRYLHEEVERYHDDALLRDEHRPDGEPLQPLAGFEMTWYDGSGHLNVFDTDWFATARGTVVGPSFNVPPGDLKYDLPTFYARLKQDPRAIAQFNHPDPAGKGNFFDFAHLDPEVDERVQLIEVKNDVQLEQFQQALDAGWHLAPTFNGDEHQARWVGSREAITGIWARERSTTGLYQAMRERSLYATHDVNTVLRFSAGDHLMGSVLPADTGRARLEVDLQDADPDERFRSVEIVSNQGVRVHSADVGDGPRVSFSHEVSARDGDFFYVLARQDDGQLVVSAPVWVGERTRGADYAPEVTLLDPVPATVQLGQRVELPAASATDDSGAQPALSSQVWDDAGPVPVVDGGFTVRSYSDHFVVVKAEDAAGNIGTELRRLQVGRSDLDPETVFSSLQAPPTPGPRPGTVGLGVSTDLTIDRAYAQLRPLGARDWRSLPVLAAEDPVAHDIDTIALPGQSYVDSITGQSLQSHEFTSPTLRSGREYEYRFGVAVDGAAPDPADASAWTGVRGTVVAAGRERYDSPLHLLGSIAGETAADFDDAAALLDTSTTATTGSGVVVQTGDLVLGGTRRERWEAARSGLLDRLRMPLAPVVGAGEELGNRNGNVVDRRPSFAFTSRYTLPGSAPIGESAYSFRHGDTLVLVLNTGRPLADQVGWLAAELDEQRPRGPVVVVGHASYFGSDTDEQARQEMAAALQELGVDLYVGGEARVYQRTAVLDGRQATSTAEEAAGVTFLSLGSAGAAVGQHRPLVTDDVVVDDRGPLVSVLVPSRTGLGLRTFDAGGAVVDEAVIG